MKTAGDSQDALESPWGGSRDAPVRLLRRPKGSWESPGRLQGGSREAFATPPVAPRSLPSGSREAFGRRQTQSRHFGGFQGGPGATRDPQEPPKNPPRTPQEPPKNPLKTLFGDPCPRRFGAIAHPESVSSRSGVLKGVFQKSARRLDGKHILEDFVLLHRPEQCLS